MDLSNCVLIFDEAHNLESLCSDASSIDLRATDITNALKEVASAMRLVEYGEYDVKVCHGPLFARFFATGLSFRCRPYTGFPFS